jgi:ABC-type sugar transport system ATPase subunit
MTSTASDRPVGDLSVVLEIDGVTKSFGRTQALRGVTLTMRRGEFVALLGSNGAGKSTLIKILDGVYGADAGSVTVTGGRRAMGVVHQDLGLVETMTVAENLFLGTPRRLVRPRAEAEQAARALRTVGLPDIDPHTLVSSLSLGERAMVAVARTLDRGAQTVIVDEVTAGLHPNEARWVVEHLRGAAEGGATVVMVTHKLREVVGIATRFVVLSDGQVVLDSPGEEIDLDGLVEVMSSHRAEVSVNARDVVTVDRSDVLCSVKDAFVGPAGPVSFDVTAGGVTAITGPLGSGLHEVAYLVAGRLRPDRGRVTLTRSMRRACVPAHRETDGVFVEDTIEFNITAGAWRSWRGRSGLVNVRSIRAAAQRAMEALSVVPNRLDVPVGQLSGGNQQKTVLARALIQQPDLLVLCEPTRGVDVATRKEIYMQVRRAVDSGVAVFLASTDYEDIAALADRIGVLSVSGVITKWIDARDIASLSTEFV